MKDTFIEDIERAIRNLKDKRDSFIGSLKDKQTEAESEGFRQGLDWAIESIETVMRNHQII